MKTADAVIIGGGVTGVSIAFHLAGLGVRRVVVLERKFLGAGGTGRSVGIIRQLYPTPETTRMVRASLDVFRSFDDAVGGHSGYVGCGALIGVSPVMRAGLLARVEQQRALGVPAEGQEIQMPHKGSVVDILHRMRGHLRSAVSYAGEETLAAVRAKTVLDPLRYLTPLSPAARDESYER